MIKKLFKKRRLFRKVVAPIALSVLCAQPASPVAAKLPKLNFNSDSFDLVASEGNDIIVQLKQFCKCCGWKDCKTAKDCLAKIRQEILQKDDNNNKFKCGWRTLNVETFHYRCCLADSKSDCRLCRTSDGKDIYICLTPENFVELEGELEMSNCNADKDFMKKVESIKESIKENIKKKKEEEAKIIKRNKLLKGSALSLAVVSLFYGLCKGVTSGNDNVKLRNLDEEDDDYEDLEEHFTPRFSKINRRQQRY